MKILHVYAKNIDIFVDAVKDTDCKLNASTNINYLMESLTNYNARDVIGLVVFANPMTKKCVKLVKKFDQLFIFHQMPIILISDAIDELWGRGFFKVRHSKVFLLNSEEDSISDMDISTIFTTILAFSDSIYDISFINAERKARERHRGSEIKELTMSKELKELLKTLEKGGGHFELDERKDT